VFHLSPGFSREDVEEICQEAFLAAIRNLGTFHGASRLQTWLFRIAANKARDLLLRQSAAKRGGGQIPVSLSDPEPGEGVPLEVATSHPAPDAALMQSERLAQVRDALDLLGDPCRELLELRYFGDLSYEDLAESLELNPKTVSSRLSKCLDRLEDAYRQVVSRENSASPSV
jgi:RNA polymerase sigma-70 factor (ECF subfamily)